MLSILLMTAAHGTLLALVPAGYLVGSIPFGLIVGLARGVDVRKAGSGNIGATNVGRLLGRRFFFVVFLLDLLKGLVPTLAAGALLLHRARHAQEPANFPRQADQLGYLLWLSVGLAAILGHMFSLFLGFKGGKGVATSFGVVLGVFPYLTPAVLVAATVWGITLWRTRLMSLASILGTAAMPLAYVAVALAAGWPVFGQQWPLLAFSVLIASLVILKHRANLARLRAGTELRLSHRPHRNGDEPDQDPGDAGKSNGHPQDEPGDHDQPGERGSPRRTSGG